MNHKSGTAYMHELTLVHARGYDSGSFSSSIETKHS